MIPRSAARAFLARRLRDFRPCRAYTERRLDLLAVRLPNAVRTPALWDKMRRHQRVCFLIGAHMRRFAFLLSTGCGKTLLAIALAQYFQAAGEARRFLVLVPQRTNKYEWEREIAKHAPGAPYCVLAGSSTDKWATLHENPGALLTIATYPGLVRMACELKEVRTKRGVKRKLVPSARLVGQLARQFDGLILDESHSAKHQATLPFRICRQISKSARCVFALTGTPFGRDPGDLWAQMYLVDRGETLGVNQGIFRAALFTSKFNNWGGLEYKFDQRKNAALSRLLANRSIRFTAEQADLPAVTEVVRQVDLLGDAQSYYARARQAVIDAGGDYRETKCAFLRMRQISSGFLGYYDDELGERAEFVFDRNPKLEALLALLESVPDDPIVIYHDFGYSGEVIAGELARMRVSHARVSGRVRDSSGQLQRFLRGDARVLVLSNAMAVGLNLQRARYGIYYEAPVSVITRTQSRARVVRQFSEHERVFIYDLVCRGTVDEQILRFHVEGRDLLRAIVDGEVRPD